MLISSKLHFKKPLHSIIVELTLRSHVAEWNWRDLNGRHSQNCLGFKTRGEVESCVLCCTRMVAVLHTFPHCGSSATSWGRWNQSSHCSSFMELFRNVAGKTSCVMAEMVYWISELKIFNILGGKTSNTAGSLPFEGSLSTVKAQMNHPACHVKTLQFLQIVLISLYILLNVSFNISGNR